MSLILHVIPYVGLPPAGSPVEGDAAVLGAPGAGAAAALLQRLRGIPRRRRRLPGNSIARLRLAEFDSDPVRPGEFGSTPSFSSAGDRCLRREELPSHRRRRARAGLVFVVVIVVIHGEAEDFAAPLLPPSTRSVAVVLLRTVVDHHSRGARIRHRSDPFALLVLRFASPPPIRRIVEIPHFSTSDKHKERKRKRKRNETRKSLQFQKWGFFNGSREKRPN